jgi:hypothetical protein
VPVQTVLALPCTMGAGLFDAETFAMIGFTAGTLGFGGGAIAVAYHGLTTS